ncbi:MAG: hypothetical protein Q9163_002285 [Psora crenata]
MLISDHGRRVDSYLAKGRKLLLRQLAFPTLDSRSSLIRNHRSSRYCANGPMAKADDASYCEVDAEPLERYRKGGYHPTHLGDYLKDGRYKIIHKLGWGAYATVWLAKDLLLRRYTAIKILVSELSQDNHEAQILNRLSQGPAGHPGKKHIVQLLDQFQQEGPNGTHLCLVLELLGPSISSKAESYSSNRLPGDISWEASKQIVQGLEFIHTRGIAHGGQSESSHSLQDAYQYTPLDLHPGNIVFANTTQRNLSDTELITSLKKPRTGDVMAAYGFPLTPQVPRYLVCPTSLPSPVRDAGHTLVKIVDFGEAFLHGQQRNIHCPLVFRAPEAIFTSRQDLRADIWSLGCTIFELIVGYPPFDNFMPNRDDLIREWVSMLGDLPQEWGEYLPPPQTNGMQYPSSVLRSLWEQACS